MSYENFLIVPREMMEEIMEGHLRWCALESGGVDNWEWYGASMKDFLEESNINSISQLTKEEVDGFPTCEMLVDSLTKSIIRQFNPTINIVDTRPHFDERGFPQ